MHCQEQPPPGYPAAVVTGRVGPAVTQIALIQDGHEDRRPLQSYSLGGLPVTAQA